MKCIEPATARWTATWRSKCCPEAFTSDPERLARFEREAKVLASLNHPNIGGIHGLEESEGVKALVLELIEGPDPGGPHGAGADPARRGSPIARQIADALEAAHEQGVVHRDLKPANIKIRPDGTVKVLDFGLAKALEAAPDGASDPALARTVAATQMGMVIGTAAYMSPEQARGKAVDRRTDIWAFGVVLFEVLTAEPLFAGGGTVSDTLAAVLRDAVPWDRLPASTSPRLRALLERCLERDPRRRLRDIGDARLELEDELSGARAPDVVPGERTSSPAAASPRERVAWVALALLMAGAGWFARPTPVSDATGWRHLTQLTDQSGVEDTPVISPDGTTIAYGREVNGSWDLFVQRIGGRNPTVVAGEPDRDERWPAFSPDGQTIAFHQQRGAGGLFVVGATGENARRLTDEGFHPAWSPDGRSIAYCTEAVVDPHDRSNVSELWVIDVESGDRRKIFDGDAVQPAWSPSGARLAFWSWSPPGAQRDIYTVAADGGDLRAVVEDADLDWGVTWSPDGRHLYFSSERGGTMSLWRIGINESTGETVGVPEPVLTGVQAAPELPSFSTDGQRMVFRSSLVTANPIAVDFDPDSLQVREWRPLMQRSGTMQVSDVSPDGQWLALYTLGERQADIFVSRVDGSELRRVTDDAARDLWPRWAPDGESLVFVSNRGGRYEAWRINRDGGGLTQLTETIGDSPVGFPFFDPAGDRLFLTTQVGQNLSLDLTAEPFPVAPSELPPHDLRDAGEPLGLWVKSMSTVGRLLAGNARTGAGAPVGMAVYSLDTGQARLVSRDASLSDPTWLPDGRRLVYLLSAGSTAAIVIVDTTTGERLVLDAGPLEIFGSTVVAAPDGQTLYTNARAHSADIWMVERKP